MTTLTVARDRLTEDLRPGDEITAIDDTPLDAPLRVEDPHGQTRPGGRPAIRLHNRLASGTTWNLYPDSHVAATVTITRPTPTPAAPTAEPPTGPAASAPNAAPAQPRRVQTRRFGSLVLHNRGRTAWATADGRHGVSHQRVGYTTCDEPHPVRISAEMAAAARAHPHRGWAYPILRALAEGKSGYACPGGQEHEGPWGWIPWSDDAGVDMAAHAVCDTFRAAAEALAQALDDRR